MSDGLKIPVTRSERLHVQIGRYDYIDFLRYLWCGLPSKILENFVQAIACDLLGQPLSDERLYKTIDRVIGSHFTD